jgi:hypothetical protein
MLLPSALGVGGSDVACCSGSGSLKVVLDVRGCDVVGVECFAAALENRL